jgi:hypothetical protein
MIESRPFISRSPTFAALWRTDDNPSLPPSPPPEPVVKRTKFAAVARVIELLPLSAIVYPAKILALQPTEVLLEPLTALILARTLSGKRSA